ncbi:MAG: c-type cytochrome [Saprospiraceae bacterium]|nr:c-type cytochrome [Saprospiraceae bacterium]
MKSSHQFWSSPGRFLPAALFAVALVAIAISCSPEKKEGIAEGEEWFKSYCTTCHGENGDGQSQMASMMNPPPKNLRQIAQRRNGVFPDAEISKIIAGVEKVPGHSTTDMPAWWEAFKKTEGITDDKVLQSKIDHITAYLKTIQE